MLFRVNSEQNIDNLKSLHFSFEETSRMKINYDESKVFIVGIVEVNSEEDQLTWKLEASGKSSTRLLYYWSVILVDESNVIKSANHR